MTTTTTVTPCPVDWCRYAGAHGWDEDGTREHGRVTSGKVPSSRGHVNWSVVEAVAFEESDGTVTRVVEIPDDPELHNWDEVERVITALREAATLAFGPDGVGPADPIRAG